MIKEVDDGADLIFSFHDPLAVQKFDDPTTHGMGQMKRVDFIVAFDRQTWLIEAKDPENRRIPPLRTAAERASFRRKMHSGTLFRNELAPKLRETLVYLALSHRTPTNDILYIAFLQIARLDAAMLLTAQNKLRRLCYLPGPFGGNWASKFDVLVLNMDAWNTKLAPHSVRRP